jgi:hypothetical protein
MKWIGQHIWDYISRFRNDVYFENVENGTTDTDKFLIIGASGKLKYRTGAEVASDIGASGDITGVTAGTGLSGGGSSGDVTLNVEASQTQITAVGTITTGTWRGTAVGASYVATLNQDTSGTAAEATILETARTIGGVSFDGSANIDLKGVNIGGDQDTTGRASTVATIAGLAPNTATTQATQGNITSCANLATVGTIGTGVWQGTAIASAYLDADTAHYSATRQVTHHMILDDIDTSVVYVSLGEIDAENVTASNKNLPLIAPTAGKLLKVFLRTTNDTSTKNLTWKLYTRTTSQSTNGDAAEVGAKTGAGPTNKTMVTYDFTTGVTGTNAIAAGDKVLLSIESDASTSNGSYYITCLWEWDLS